MAVKYGSNDAVLKVALLEAWRQRCHWCHRPLQFEHADIDHLIPKGISGGELERARKVFNLLETFEVDGVENLAPICSRPCNGRRGKGRDVPWDNAAFAGTLSKANRMSAAVVKSVEEFTSGNKVSRAFQVLASAPLADAKIRDEFVDRATLVAQRAANCTGSALQYVVESSCESVKDASRGLFYFWRLEFLESSRSARYAIEEVFGFSLEGLLQVVARQLENEVIQVVEEAAAQFEHEIDSHGHEHYRTIESGEPPNVVFTLSGVSLAYHVDTLEAHLEGRLDADHTASAVESSVHGDDLYESSVYMTLSAKFEAVLTLDSDPSTMEGSLELVFRADPYSAWIE